MKRQLWISAFFSGFLITTSLLLFTVPAVANAFLEHCHMHMTDRLHKTVAALLREAGTFECAEANAALSKRTFLDLGGQEITDLAPLADFHQLSSLNLSDNQIANLWPLADLTALDHLWLKNNQIEDLTPLAFLPGLRVLNLDHNFIQRVMALKELPLLFGRGLSIAHNPISDEGNNDPARAEAMDYLHSMLWFHECKQAGLDYDKDLESLDDYVDLLDSSIRRGDLSVAREVAANMPDTWMILNHQDLMADHILGTKKALIAVKNAPHIAGNLVDLYLENAPVSPEVKAVFARKIAPKRVQQISKVLEHFIAEGAALPHEEWQVKRMHKHLQGLIMANTLPITPFAIRKECMRWADDQKLQHRMPLMKAGFNNLDF